MVYQNQSLSFISLRNYFCQWGGGRLFLWQAYSYDKHLKEYYMQKSILFTYLYLLICCCRPGITAKSMPPCRCCSASSRERTPALLSGLAGRLSRSSLGSSKRSDSTVGGPPWRPWSFCFGLLLAQPIGLCPELLAFHCHLSKEWCIALRRRW